MASVNIRGNIASFFLFFKYSVISVVSQYPDDNLRGREEDEVKQANKQTKTHSKIKNKKTSTTVRWKRRTRTRWGEHCEGSKLPNEISKWKRRLPQREVEL